MAVRQLKGKRVFVTGAASGIGAAIALAFAREGCEVLLCDMDSRGLVETGKAVAEVGGVYSLVELDVTDARRFREVARQSSDRQGPVQILVNNAGIAAHGSFLNTPADAFRRVVEVNLFGVYNGCRAFLPLMLQSSEACHIVNVASLASIAPMPNMSGYAASKYAVDGMTESLALELAGSNVGLTCVHPGVINTPIADGRSFNAEEGAQQTRRLGEYYLAHGSSPDIVARDVVQAVKKGRAHLWTGREAWITEKIRRLSPGLLRRLLLRKAREIGYQ